MLPKNAAIDPVRSGLRQIFDEFKQDVAAMPDWFHENQYTSLFTGCWIFLV